MSDADELLAVSQSMLVAARSGDLSTVQRLVQMRQAVVDRWLQHQPSAPLAQQVLALDAEVAEALREGLADLRRQASSLHQSARALAGYGLRRPTRSRWLDRRA